MKKIKIKTTLFSLCQIGISLCFLCLYGVVQAQANMVSLEVNNTNPIVLEARSNHHLNQVHLSWTVVANPDAVFVMYKSADSGKTWSLMSNIAAAELKQYNGAFELVDPLPQALNWYKLLVGDAHGRADSSMAEIDFRAKHVSLLKSYQSKPSSGNFGFSLKNQAGFKVVNSNGELVKYGVAKDDVVIYGLEKGLYLLHIIGMEHIETYRVLIQ